MNLIRIAGIIILAVLFAFKVNCFLLSLKGDSTKLGWLKKWYGYSIGAALLIGILVLEVLFKVNGAYVQCADLLLTLVFIAIVDAKYKIIPNLLSLFLFLSQIIAIYTVCESRLSVLSVLISVVLFGLLYVISRITNEEVGMGDVKLLVIINMIYGLSYVLYTAIFAMLIMLLCMVPMMIMKKANLKTAIPFAPFYAVGVIVYTVLNYI